MQQSANQNAAVVYTIVEASVWKFREASKRVHLCIIFAILNDALLLYFFPRKIVRFVNPIQTIVWPFLLFFLILRFIVLSKTNIFFDSIENFPSQ